MAGGHAQSAVSKQIDFTITQEVLRAYGTAVKDLVGAILTAIGEARQDGVHDFSNRYGRSRYHRLRN